MTKNSNINTRDYALDYLKGFAIFWVLWGRCRQYVADFHHSDQPL